MPTSEYNIDPPTKQCARCLEIFPWTHEFFHKHRDSLRHDCKWCNSKRAKSWLLNNREQNRATQKNWRKKNPEKVQASSKKARKKNCEKNPDYDKEKYYKDPKKHYEATKAWRAKNHEKVLNINKKWRQANPEKVREKDKAWIKANPDKMNAIRQRRRSREKGAPINNLTASQWEDIKAHFGYRCVYCPHYNPGCKECHNKSHKLTRDHVTPYIQNGSNTLWNVVPSCRSCNSKKGPKDPPIPIQPMLL